MAAAPPREPVFYACRDCEVKGRGPEEVPGLVRCWSCGLLAPVYSWLDRGEAR